MAYTACSGDRMPYGLVSSVQKQAPVRQECLLMLAHPGCADCHQDSTLPGDFRLVIALKHGRPLAKSCN